MSSRGGGGGAGSFPSCVSVDMLGKKGSGAGMVMVDRGRVGERLQAALAGLQELHLLRDRQGDMVSWALRADREEPVTSVRSWGPAGPHGLGSEELRLEATLTALKQQLSRLRKQDVGLKTHLHQLDQQISELKLDVNKASTEQLESDSRPSSGFYELSDGGSCSLSNSCTSVYSECLSSSQTSLLPNPMSPANYHISPQPRADVCRRRSADESTAQPAQPRGTGLHLGSSRIRASATSTDQVARPRPVSTGDLDRIMTHGPGYSKYMDPNKPPMGPNLKTCVVDPKFQRNLESRSGTEVYRYPSPLHAVALQSPIFYCGGETGTPGILKGHESNSFDKTQSGYDAKTIGYIDKILQRSLDRVQNETFIESPNAHSDCNRRSTEVRTMCPEVPQKDSMPSPHQAKTPGIILLDNDPRRHCMTYSSQELTDNTDHKQPVRAPEVAYLYSCPVVMKEYSSDEVNFSSLKSNKKLQGESGSVKRSNSEKRCVEDPDLRLHEKNSHRQRAAIGHSSSNEERQTFDAHIVHSASPEFVHAKFVPAESERVKVQQAERKTKALKLKRKSSDKVRAVKQAHGYLSGERTKDTSATIKGEHKKLGKGKVTQKFSKSNTEDHRYGSGSDSSLHSPRLRWIQKVNPKPLSIPIIQRSSKNCGHQCPNAEQPLEQRKRKQTSTKWQLDVDVLPGPLDQHQLSKESKTRGSGSSRVIRSMSARHCQWTGPSRHFRSSTFSHSFLHDLNARYPPAPFNISSRYPPRCESEYSAECASLFHSTIAESSEGEMSDNTTNRFGDGEFSQSYQSYSDSDSSLSVEEDEDQVDIHRVEGGLVWADSALGPTTTDRPLRQLPPHPEPAACRIKASRALKKKIRRFQPASLKVMTLV
ncbi:dapper homolog 2 [Gouania willdenowi]|nr:dapper homolog 2 [Gouania willdenowi]